MSPLHQIYFLLTQIRMNSFKDKISYFNFGTYIPSIRDENRQIKGIYVRLFSSLVSAVRMPKTAKVK